MALNAYFSCGSDYVNDIAEDPMMPFAPSLFARGYLLSDSQLEAPDGWRHAKFDQFNLWCHPYLNALEAQEGDAKVVVLGIIYDARFPNKSQEDVVSEMASKLTISEKNFFELLDLLGGRFVVFFRSKEGPVSVVGDATGMRSIYYYKGASLVISSHVNLLKKTAANSEDSQSLVKTFGYPGRQTKFKNIYILNPNSYLRVSDMRPIRFWPRAEVEQKPLAEVVGEVERLLENGFNWINGNYKPFLTLTAGLDSRVSLAIANSNAKYVTYIRPEKEGTIYDAKIASEMAEGMGLDHRVLAKEIPKKIPSEYSQYFSLNVDYVHFRGVTLAYKDHVVEHPTETVHIRSNLSEIGRSFDHYKKIDPKCGMDLVKLWTWNKDLHSHDMATLFDEFASITGFFEAPIDKCTLFYWEHRMGNWISQVNLETDIACETLVLFNVRDIFVKMLSVPEPVQRKGIVLKKIIERRCPELVDFPINGKPFWS